MSPATEYKGHLQLKCSTAEWHIKTILLHPMYSLQAAELIHGNMKIQSQSMMYKLTISYLHFTATLTSVSHVSFKLQLREIESHVLIAQSTNLTFFVPLIKLVGLLSECMHHSCFHSQSFSRLDL